MSKRADPPFKQCLFCVTIIETGGLAECVQEEGTNPPQCKPCVKAGRACVQEKALFASDAVDRVIKAMTYRARKSTETLKAFQSIMDQICDKVDALM